MKAPVTFPAKILLFGEYTVLLGFRALALPLHGRFSPNAFLEVTGESPDERFYEWLSYLLRHPGLSRLEYFQSEKLKSDINSGLRFQTTIPEGYGLGSSGALCAATLQRYGSTIFLDQLMEDIVSLKELLGYMESWFHGKSSGLDPLVSFIRKPVITSPNGIELLSEGFSPDWKNIYLIDSGQSRNTASLVKLFQDLIHSDARFNSSMNSIGQLQVSALEQWIKKEDTFPDTWKKISELQWKYMQAWIPANIKLLWEGGLTSGNWYIKLCGAGGGGYFLVWCADGLISSTKEWIPL